MHRRVRAIQYGVGTMGKIFVRRLVEKGVDVVGAIGHKSNIGKDLGEVCELGYPLNVTISDDADAVLSELEADIVIVAVASLMEDIYPLLKRCAENGKNAITIGEEALYPWTTSPVSTAKLDRLAKKNGVTIAGSGYQDIFWVNLITLVTGGSHRIDSIKGTGKFNVDDYGPELAKVYGVDMTGDEFEAKIVKGAQVPSYFRNTVEMICSQIGWTIKSLTQTTEPIVADEPIASKAVDKTIEKGKVIGKKETMTVETFEGPRIVADLLAKVYEPGEEDENSWNITGMPDIRVETPRPATVDLTIGTVINRIPDIINSEPGFVTVEKMPQPLFKPFHPGHYVS